MHNTVLLAVLVIRTIFLFVCRPDARARRTLYLNNARARVSLFFFRATRANRTHRSGALEQNIVSYITTFVRMVKYLYFRASII